MERVITRAEFEKRLGDMGQGMVKAFRTYEAQWNAKLDDLNARVQALEAVKPEEEKGFWRGWFG